MRARSILATGQEYLQWENTRQADLNALLEHKSLLDNDIFDAYGIEQEQRGEAVRYFSSGVIDSGVPGRNSPEDSVEQGEVLDYEPDQEPSDSRSWVSGILSYVLGCSFGRWDVRMSLDAALAPELRGPFDPLPVCSPGTLVDSEGLPARPGVIPSLEWLQIRPDATTLLQKELVGEPTAADTEYPLRVSWDGLLVDDSGHSEDVVRRAREVLELRWGASTPAIEREACEILSVKSLRDYFRSPRAFWDYHLNRYSKSRRRAPIYWLLQSRQRHYALWLYYQRLDRDVLYKALRNYVEPKRRLEEQRLNELQDRTAATTEGRDRKGMERQVEAQTELLNDVVDFAERLEKAAGLGLDPDLDDGVILNIAPLHDLVPWKEPKKYWDELLAGKYEWSSIGKQLRAKGLVLG